MQVCRVTVVKVDELVPLANGPVEEEVFICMLLSSSEEDVKDRPTDSAPNGYFI